MSPEGPDPRNESQSREVGKTRRKEGSSSFFVRAENGQFRGKRVLLAVSGVAR